MVEGESQNATRVATPAPETKPAAAGVVQTPVPTPKPLSLNNLPIPSVPSWMVTAPGAACTTCSFVIGATVFTPTLPLLSNLIIEVPVEAEKSIPPALNNCKGLNVDPGIFVTVYVVPFTLVLHSIPEVVLVIPIALPHIPGPLTESPTALVPFVLISTVGALFAAFVLSKKPAETFPF